MNYLNIFRLILTTLILAVPLVHSSVDRYEYRPVSPKSVNLGKVTPPTKDWDLVYQVLNKVSSENLKNGIRRSIRGITGADVLGSLLYGLSMAAGLALGVSAADTDVINQLIKRVDHRFLRRSNLDPKRLLSNKLSEPILQKYVAPAKDGKDHYHHVVHYHVPYPLSVGALESARQNFPHISWYNTHSSINPGKVVLSGYLSPIYRAPDVIPQPHNSIPVQSIPENQYGGQYGDEGIRRNDFQVYSNSDYFRNVNRRGHSNMPTTTSRSRDYVLTTTTPKIPSFEEVFFGEHHRFSSPTGQNFQPNLQSSFQALEDKNQEGSPHEGDSFPSGDMHSFQAESGQAEALIANNSTIKT